MLFFAKKNSSRAEHTRETKEIYFRAETCPKINPADFVRK